MRKHIQRVHLKAKNFLCDKCEFRAFIQAELDAHIREKHLKIFKFNCHICHKEEIRMGFPTKKRLYRHIKFAHQVDPAAEDNEENRELIYNLYYKALKLEPEPKFPELTFSQRQLMNRARKFVTLRMKRRKELSMSKQGKKNLLKQRKLLSEQVMAQLR